MSGGTGNRISSALLNDHGFSILETKCTEGVVRNSVYTLPGLGWMVRFLKWPISIVFHAIDTISIQLFGPSNIYLACKKSKNP
jgi:hypothetical protein